MVEQPAQIGPYRIGAPLGRGGMGVVYRAHHSRTGEQVALKTVQVPNTRQLHSIRREIHGLMQIDHPGIVRIVDTGVERGMPWYAMEHLPGLSMRESIAQITGLSTSSSVAFPIVDLTQSETLELDSQGVPVEVEVTDQGLDIPDDRPLAAAGMLHAVLELVSRLCEPLAYLHGEGFVHRDLKPDNIVVLPDGSPVLVDFGLITRFAGVSGREALVLPGRTHGTVAYMAPEQIRGEMVDARADLYSLGCILYELVTGRLPFRSKSIGRVLYMHLSMPPLPMSRRVDGIPPALDNLVQRLLAKRPQERQGYADDVAAALAQLDIPRRRPAHAPRPRAYLYRPRFSGRTQEMDEIQGALARAAPVVFLGGESGIGKTRAAAEVATEARTQGFKTLTGQCTAVAASAHQSAGEALEPLRVAMTAIADSCLGDQATTDRVFGRRTPLLLPWFPFLSNLVDEGAEAPPSLGPEQSRRRAFGALTEAFEAFAHNRRMLLVLDDIQWADDLTLQWLSSLSRTRPERLRVLATYRREEVGPLLSGLLIQAPRVTLGRLDRDAVGAMVGDMLALDPPPGQFVDFLYVHSEGVPFFVAEYLKAAVAEALLHRDDKGRWQVSEPNELQATEEVYASLPLPRTLSALVERRLSLLDADTAAVVSVAAILGRTSHWNLLRAVVARLLPDVDVLRAVHQLVAAQVLEDVGDQVRFVHDTLREAAYERARDPSATHAAAAHVMESMIRDVDVGLGELGHHWHRAGELNRARDRYLAGARKAVRRYAWHDAERLFRRWLDLSARPTTESVEVRNELAMDALHILGRNSEAMDHLQTALRVARHLEDDAPEATTLLSIGRLTAQIGRLEDATQAFREALEHARGALSDTIRVTLGAHLADTGELDEARTVLEASLGHQSDGLKAATARLHLARVHFLADRPAESLRLYSAALPVFRDAGDTAGVVSCLNGLANVHKQAERLPEALELYRRALQVHKEVGDRLREGVLLANIALTLHASGKSDESHATYLEALTIFRDLGHHRYQGHALHSIARHRRIEGRLDIAGELQRQALVLLVAVGDRRWEGMCHVELAALARARGRLDSAEDHARRALDAAEQAQHPGGQVAALCERASVALRREEDPAPWLARARKIAATESLQDELALKALAGFEPG